MDINKNANLSMLCDYYELTMGNGYFVQGMQDRITYFDIFFSILFPDCLNPQDYKNSICCKRICHQFCDCVQLFRCATVLQV